MAVVFEKPTLSQRLVPLFRGFDLPLILVVALLTWITNRAFRQRGQ